MCSKTGISVIDHQGGYILLISLLVLVLLTLTAVYAAYQSSTEVRVASNNKLSKQAFYQAQAGLEEARVRLLGIGQSPPFTADWSTSFSSSSSLHYSVSIRHKNETDLGRDLNGNGSRNDVVFWGDANGDGTAEQNATAARPIEVATSTGTVGTAKAILVAEFTRDFIPVEYAAFGDEKVRINNAGAIVRGNPSSGKNTSAPYVAGVASNEEVELANTAKVYGDVIIGRSSSNTQGRLTGNGAAIYGAAPDYVNRVEPDPLGMFASSSQLAKDFTTYSAANDNGKAVKTRIEKVNGQDTTVTAAGLAGGQIDLVAGETLNLPAGNYHVSSVQLKAGSTLNVDVSSGPVNIYLTGELKADGGSDIRLLPAGGTADKFVVYSNSSERVAIESSGQFTGAIYAPKADIFLFHQGDFYGMVWGKNVAIENAGDVVYDPRLKCCFTDSRYSLFSWKERRN